jgi:hypothetical protein
MDRRRGFDPIVAAVRRDGDARVLRPFRDRGVQPQAVAAEDVGARPEPRDEGDAGRPQVLTDANADVLQDGRFVLRRLADAQDRDELVDEGIRDLPGAWKAARIRSVERQGAQARRRHTLRDDGLGIAAACREGRRQLPSSPQRRRRGHHDPSHPLQLRDSSRVTAAPAIGLRPKKAAADGSERIVRRAGGGHRFGDVALDRVEIADRKMDQGCREADGGGASGGPVGGRQLASLEHQRHRAADVAQSDGDAGRKQRVPHAEGGRFTRPAPERRPASAYCPRQ